MCLAALAAADVDSDVESPAPVRVTVGAQVATMKPGFVSFNIDFDNRPSQLQSGFFTANFTDSQCSFANQFVY